MSKKRVFKKKELEGPPPEFVCKDCGSKNLRTTNVAKAYINIEDDDGTIKKEQIKKRYRDCQGCGERWVTFETIMYKVRKQSVSVKKTQKKKAK